MWRVPPNARSPPEIVEDAAQDVFVVVHRRLPEFEGEVTSVRGSSGSPMGRRHRATPVADEAEHELVDEAIPDGADGPSTWPRAAKLSGRSSGSSNGDGPGEAHGAPPLDIEEMTANEVADLLEINVNTVYSRLRLAREQFRRLLETTTHESKEASHEQAVAKRARLLDAARKGWGPSTRVTRAVRHGIPERLPQRAHVRDGCARARGRDVLDRRALPSRERSREVRGAR